MSHRRPRGGRTPNPPGKLRLPSHQRWRARGSRGPNHRVAGGLWRRRNRRSPAPLRGPRLPALAVACGWQWLSLLWGAINLAAVAVGLSLSRGRPSPPHPASRSMSDYVGVLRDVRRWLLPLALVGAVFKIVAFFGPLLLNSKFGLPANLAGVAVALWILAGTVATFFFGRLSARFGRYRALVASFAGLGVATLVVGTIR